MPDLFYSPVMRSRGKCNLVEYWVPALTISILLRNRFLLGNLSSSYLGSFQVSILPEVSGKY